MSEYILVLLWLAVAGLVSIYLRKDKVNVNGKIEYRENLLWAIIVMAPIIWWVGTRDYIGDTYNYARTFLEMPGQIGGIASYMSGVSKDKGFYFLTILIKVFLTKDKTIYFLILAAIQGGFLIRLYRKYSIQYVVSIFLFIASTDYISWMYNGIRQFTAVTVSLLAFDYMLRKKYTRAVVAVLVASLFHQSALLMIPFLFICRGRAWNKYTVLFVAMAIIAVTGIEEFTGLMDSMLAETQYKNVVSDWQSFEDDGTNALRVLVYMMPTILAFFGKKVIDRENDPVINYCVNMSLISTGFYIVSMFTSGVFIGRLPIYFSIYNYILLPWEVTHLFTKNSAKIVKISMVVGYLLFYYYSMHIMWSFI